MEDIEKVLHITQKDVHIDPIDIAPVPLLHHTQIFPYQLAKDTLMLVHNSQYICTVRTVYKNRSLWWWFRIIW